MTQEQYYSDENSEGQGSYQFIFLEELVANFIQSYTGDDTILGTVPRFKIVQKMKQQIRELSFSTLHSVKAVELSLGDTLDIIKPNDMVDYIRVSFVDNGKIYPMSQNRHAPLAVSYLQDNNAYLLYDQDGDVLIGSSLLEQESDKLHTSILEGVDTNRCFTEYEIIDRPLYNLDTSINHNGTFSQDDRRIHFSSDAANKTILLEYITDNLNVSEEAMKVHKFAEQALYASVNHELSKVSIKVPNYEKVNIKRERDALVRNAKVRLLGLKPQEVIQMLKAFNKWIR